MNEPTPTGPAIADGMVPYGPDHRDYPNAPSDWDGGPYLCRDGGMYHMRGYGWEHGLYCAGATSDWDRIAYTPTASGLEAAHDGEAMDEATFRERLRAKIRPRGIAKWSAEHLLSDEQVGAFLRGKRPPEPKLLDAIGVERIVTYRVPREFPCRADLPQPQEGGGEKLEALEAWAFNVALECMGHPEGKVGLIVGGAILDLRDLNAILERALAARAALRTDPDGEKSDAE